MSRFVVVKDANTGRMLHLEPKAFERGVLMGVDPVVALVIRSPEGDVAAVVELLPTDAHVLSERLRQEAELASVIEAEKSAGQKKEEYQA